MADQLEPRGWTPLLRRRLPNRPGADLVRPRVAARGERRVELLRRVRREADQGASARLRPRLGDRHVVLADVDPVGAARLDQLGVVVDEEQRAVRVGGSAERLGQGDQLLRASRRLLAKLDQVGAPAERCIQERLGIAVAGPPVADEVEASGVEARRRKGLRERRSWRSVSRACHRMLESNMHEDSHDGSPHTG